jgi:hypothetical protein
MSDKLNVKSIVNILLSKFKVVIYINSLKVVAIRAEEYIFNKVHVIVTLN